MVNEPSRLQDDSQSDGASGLAIEALSFIASDSLLFNRFLRLTGLELENLREAADDPSFLAGVLDFILSDEKTLHDFADHSSVPPARVAAARRIIAASYAESHY